MPLDIKPVDLPRQETSVRLRLRAATADLHARVDASFSGPFEFDTAAYGDFLQALARSVLPLEQMLDMAHVERLLPDWALRRRSSLLVRDLKVLGRSIPSLTPAPLAGNDAWLFGVLYVLEGSRLGGKVLLRRVLDNPDPTARAATHYLQHGAVRNFWLNFVECLEASPCVTRAPADAIAGARAAFAMFGTSA
jgi:heme oxygenase (biliverdin-IX-beta and delta-forming)